MVFLTYFRILKHSRHSPLLQPVLEGLGKWVQLSQFVDTVMYLISKQVYDVNVYMDQPKPLNTVSCSASKRHRVASVHLYSTLSAIIIHSGLLT